MHIFQFKISFPSSCFPTSSENPGLDELRILQPGRQKHVSGSVVTPAPLSAYPAPWCAASLNSGAAQKPLVCHASSPSPSCAFMWGCSWNSSCHWAHGAAFLRGHRQLQEQEEFLSCLFSWKAQDFCVFKTPTLLYNLIEIYSYLGAWRWSHTLPIHLKRKTS